MITPQFIERWQNCNAPKKDTLVIIRQIERGLDTCIWNNYDPVTGDAIIDLQAVDRNCKSSMPSLGFTSSDYEYALRFVIDSYTDMWSITNVGNGKKRFTRKKSSKRA